MNYNTLQVILFSIIVIIALLVDLFAHKADKEISVKNAFAWSCFWIILALCFAFYIGKSSGIEDAYSFLSGYLLEKSLSVDNLFVFMAIFTSFSVIDKYQHRVLYYGIAGALIMRLLFIAVGTKILNYFGKPALGIFGVFILFTAWKMWQSSRNENKEIADYSNHWAIKFTRKILPVSDKLDGNKFFTKENGKTLMTPLFMCLITIEFVDVMFAFDSVPAIIAITEKPFLVYTSNIFAILGLRSMYFLLAAAKKYLCHLEKSVIAILVFIGIKMLIDLAGIYHIKPSVNLIIVCSLLFAGIAGSYIFPNKVK